MPKNHNDASVTSTLTTIDSIESITITVANVSHLTKAFSIQSESAYISTMVFSVDGTLLATGSAEGAISLWSTQTGKRAALLQGHTDVINDLAFSPNGKFLASASRDKTVRMWNTTDGKELAVFRDHLSNVTHVSFSPDNKMLLSSGENAAILWQLPTKTKVVLAEVQEDAPAFTGRFSPDGSIIVVSARNSDTEIWTTSSLKLQGKLLCHNGGVSADIFTPIVFRPDGRLVACGLASGAIQVWDIVPLKELITFQQKDDTVMDLLFSPNGKVLATTGDNTVQLWSISSRTALLDQQLDCSTVTNAVFSPDSSLLGYGGYCPKKETGFLTLFDTNSGRQVTIFNIKGLVSHVAFHPKGTQIVTTVGGEIHFWMLH
ncbi:MAG: WD40 repeat domain-containing protein [Chloroflexota bacterium]